jgi:aspartyl-tRNA(Asn)/glutamyl-tRNA(Gln) amidotransferase subunit C
MINYSTINQEYFMSLTTADINKVAHLARLELEPEFAANLIGDLNNILKLVDTIQKTDVTNIKPMAHSAEISQRMEQDVVSEANVREELQGIAPQATAGLYLVPQFVE